MMQVNYSAKLRLTYEGFLTGNYIANTKKALGLPNVALLVNYSYKSFVN